jgi:PPOX class probable F420-dependent enzyme
VDEQVVRARLAAAPVGRLATVTADGRPHVVPCCFTLVGPTLYSAVDHKPKTTTALRRLANVAANPAVALLVDHYEDDWSALWWIRVDGSGRVLPPGPERDAAVAALVAKYDQYRGRPPAGPVLAVDVAGWRAWP